MQGPIKIASEADGAVKVPDELYDLNVILFEVLAVSRTNNVGVVKSFAPHDNPCANVAVENVTDVLGDVPTLSTH